MSINKRGVLLIDQEVNVAIVDCLVRCVNCIRYTGWGCFDCREQGPQNKGLHLPSASSFFLLLQYKLTHEPKVICRQKKVPKRFSVTEELTQNARRWIGTVNKAENHATVVYYYFRHDLILRSH